MMKILMIIIGATCSLTGLLYSFTMIEGSPPQEITGNWVVHSAKVTNCSYVNDSSFEGSGNNCYQLGRSNICRTIRWNIRTDSLVVITTDDYYPSYDSTIVSSTRNLARFMTNFGQLQLCDSLGVDCSDVIKSMNGDTLILENNIECTNQYKLIMEQ